MNNNQEEINFDKRIRQLQKKKDLLEVSEVKQDIAREEEEIKQFFNDSQKKVDTDPTLTRLERYNEKQQAFKDIIKEIQPQKFLTGFMNYNPSTPEEIETLIECKQVILINKNLQTNFIKFGLLGVTITQLTNFYFGRVIPKSLRVFGFFVGIFGGGIYGLIHSMEYTLKRFESLGPDYNLGRLAILEIEEYRMDKNLFKDKNT